MGCINGGRQDCKKAERTAGMPCSNLQTFMNENTFFDLPDNLPVPQNDGAAAHLTRHGLAGHGSALHLLHSVSLRQRRSWRSFAYPLTGRPGISAAHRLE